MCPTHPEAEDPAICDYEGSTYRIDFWEGQGREYEDAAERLALRRLLPPTGGRLLDLGAGFGRLASLYEGYEDVILLDYSRSQLEYARERLGDGRYVYVAGDLYHLPIADGAVDTAVMVRVLHHLVDVPAAFGQVRRVLRGGGTFVLEFANKRHLKNIFRHLLGRGPNPFDPTPYEFADLHYDFHPTWVLECLREAGFVPGRQAAVSFFRLPALKRAVPASALARVDALLQPLLAPLSPAPSQFVCSRAEGGAASTLPPRGRLFRCPDCGYAPLVDGHQAVECPSCGRSFPIINGVYVFK